MASRLGRPTSFVKKRKWGKIAITSLVLIGTIFGVAKVLEKQKVYR